MQIITNQDLDLDFLACLRSLHTAREHAANLTVMGNSLTVLNVFLTPAGFAFIFVFTRNQFPVVDCFKFNAQLTIDGARWSGVDGR